MPRIDSQLSQQRWEACKSTLSEEVPAFAVVEVIDAEIARELGSAGDEPILRVRKVQLGEVSGDVSGYDSIPSESYSTRGHRIRFNGPVPIPAGGFGYVTRDVPTHALCHSVFGAPTVVDNLIYVPVVNKFYLGEVYGFTGDNPTNFVRVFQLAMVTSIPTDVSGCVVGYVTPQSNVRQSA